MQSFASFFASLLMASSCATGLPTTSSTSNRNSSVTAKHNGKFKHNGPAALTKAYQKYGKPVLVDVANAISRQVRRSSTAMKLDECFWSITYGDWSRFRGAVEATEEVSSQFSQDAASSGLLGLAFSSLNTVQTTHGEDFWAFTSTGYVVGSGSLTRTSIYGLADTGTTLLLLPDSIVEASQGGYTFCYSVNLPSFFFWRVRLYRYHPWDVPQLCFR
ncbi:Type I transmembrane sorting receptor [Metarhizium rileyi]|uniref:Type I transmembrane sorting receptor n=1 Tax=Metarhizium rileyi (strain RCEF 4871) TaxID=1649241 RepID=A0A5C6G2W8_METRR|nr:Type I transmembrane sorting receptor [Metarhizium rileyi]